MPLLRQGLQTVTLADAGCGGRGGLSHWTLGVPVFSWGLLASGSDPHPS